MECLQGGIVILECLQYNIQYTRHRIMRILPQFSIYISLCLWLYVFETNQAILNQVSACAENCESCQESNIKNCHACKHGYQPTTIKTCLPSTTTQNCMFYNENNVCIVCRPTFRLTARSMCIKMSDGCLISGPAGSCMKCINGAMLDSSGLCLAGHLNCKKVNSNFQCFLCQFGYRLEKGKCVNDNKNCVIQSSVNGLCVLCKQGYILVGYICVINTSQSIPNCYLFDPSDSSSSPTLTCIYCKMGYQLFYGKCYAKKKIDNYDKCPAIYGQYFNRTACFNMTQYCSNFDFGYLRCTLCEGNRAIFTQPRNGQISFTCLDTSMRYCQKPNYTYNKSNMIQKVTCLSCYPGYYFSPSSTTCQKYPASCTQVKDQKCTACRASFRLNNNSKCEDINCQIFNQTDYTCLRCKQNYIINQSTQVCVFFDFNCVNRTADSAVCVQCRVDYVYDGKTNLCQYRDPNCKVYMDKGECMECRIGYYIAINNTRCNPMPPNCALSNQNGQCLECNKGYRIQRRTGCQAIKSAQLNCIRWSRINSNQCQQCKTGYYIDKKQTCQQLPFLCQQFDVDNRICRRCASDTYIKNGLCFHNFCLYFGEANQCLGCKPGYQFGRKGQCVRQQLDTNCKLFSNNTSLCKACADRYYFDDLWNCQSISEQCNQYDINTGDCLSCYPGFALQNGQCIQQSMRKICKKQLTTNMSQCQQCSAWYSLDPLTWQCTYLHNGCIQVKNISTSFCLKCQQNLTLDRIAGICIKSNYSILINGTNITKQDNGSYDNGTITYEDRQCVRFNAQHDKCQLCVERFYFDGTKCVAIDANCKKFNQSTGQCYQCYIGYSISQASSKSCQLEKQTDAYCKTMDKLQNKCIQCYNGYNINDKLKCQLSKPKDMNCKIFDNSGTICQECYMGYSYSKELRICTTVQLLCSSADAYGNCLSCYGGYTLLEGKCIIGQTTTTSTTSKTSSTPTTTASTVSPINSETNATKASKQAMNSSATVPTSPITISGSQKSPSSATITANTPSIPSTPSTFAVETATTKPASQQVCPANKAYDLDLLGCEYPKFGLDRNCKQYRSRMCVACKQNYKLIKVFCQLITK